MLPAIGADGIADPEVASLDPDFAVQGEYTGSQAGLQVIARGDGEFDLAIYEGGLPGAGAKPLPPRRIEGDADVVANLVESMGLRRIERVSPTIGAKPPAGAQVLFDGTQQSIDEHWIDGRLSEQGLLIEGTSSKSTFQDYTLHLEFRTPWMPTKSGQARGNSGVYHQGRYETQILDSFGLQGLDNETGGIYTVQRPTLNMCFPPLQWQTYDVDFTAARFDVQGNKVSEARLTVRLNGVLVQNDVAVPTATRAAKLPEGPSDGPIYLQDHGNPVRFRNIWILPRDSERDARRPIVPGFERFFAGSATPSADGGELLISTLACDACHRRDTEAFLPTQRGPDLSEVAGRVRADALLAMITNPHATKVGTTMPDPWRGLDSAARSERSQAIASYLLLRGQGELQERPMSRKVAQRGNELYHSIGCVACHPSRHGTATPASTSVPLGDVAHKYTVASLGRFLRNPHQVRPGLRMPALVGSPEEAFAIATYLTEQVSVRQSTAKFARRVYRGHWNALPQFDKLQPVSSDQVVGLQISDIRPGNDYGVVFEANLPIARAGKYTFRLTSDDGSAFQIGEHRLENDGIHPAQMRESTLDLAAGVYPIRIEFFNAGGGAELSLEMSDPDFGAAEIASLIQDEDHPVSDDLLPSRFVPQASLVDAGKQWFTSTGCANCHAFADVGEVKSAAMPLNELRTDRGCLAASVVAPAVDYQLSRVQRTAIVAALDQRRSAANRPIDDAAGVHLTMAALNCYACHSRAQLGGPELSRDEHFQTTTPEMGLEGRLPPPLDGVGDKLNDDYLVKLLDHGANLRDYMKTRMPGYRYEPLRGFHQSMVAIDRSGELPSVANDQPEDLILAAGRQAVGNRGLACIKCHSFDGNRGGGIGAIDMLKMTERLRVEWFHRYLQDPTRYRPGTRMPNSFVDGRSALTDLYDGNPALQIDAIWRYLGQGSDADQPEGLTQGAIVLMPVDRPWIYRNFFKDVSGRGIAVGYPAGVNLIWDAERMTLAEIWKNSFIDASMHWNGRGQGRQGPLGDAVIDVDPATPVAWLPSIDAEWPAATGRELGYRFGGYKLDAAGNPTFRYRIDQTTVDDTPRPDRDQSGTLVREIMIQPQAAKPSAVLIWQAASGEIEPIENGYRIGGTCEMTIHGVDCQLIESNGKRHLRAIVPSSKPTTIKQTIRW